MNVSLSSYGSKRLGHPVVALKYWNETLLCDNQWSQNEAKVMCRELGFVTGSKFYQRKISDSNKKISFATYLGKFICSGNEASLSECERNLLPKKCISKNKLSLLLCDNGGLNGIHKSTKVAGYPFIAGENGEEYLCQQSIGNLEASVFCRMLGWKFGRSSIALAKTKDTFIRNKFTCTGKHVI